MGTDLQRTEEEYIDDGFEAPSEEDFEYPRPPEYIEPSIRKEAKEWIGLDEFDTLVKLEKRISLEVEVVRVPLSAKLWGFTYVHRELARCRVYINRCLSDGWQTFALLHEVHHLLHDSRGCYFWKQTFANMNGFEHQADQFAWAVLIDKWENGEWDY